MKKLLIATAILACVWSCARPTHTDPSNRVSYTDDGSVSEQLIYAIREVETGHHPDPPDGDNGTSIGPYQITYGCWADVTDRYDDVPGQWAPTGPGQPQTCARDDYSQKIVKRYLAIYATQDRLGRPPTDEDRARIWNGGPNGYKKKATESYWDKIVEAMKKEAK